MKSPTFALACVLLALALAAAYLLFENIFWMGRQALWLRAVLWLAPPTIAAAALWIVLRTRSPAIARLWLVLVFAAWPLGIAAFLLWPSHRVEPALSAEILDRVLLSDGSPGALVEFGFVYPIFTPMVSLRNNGAYSREFDVYLRWMDENEPSAMFRAVRAGVPPQPPSVEASASAMFGANARYLLPPLRLAPGQQAEGRLVFIIAAPDEGAAFMNAIIQPGPARFQLFANDNGELLPM